ncbi:phosphoserine aminotransferase-like [Corticium candelabrum]|uniref:phosphoserine aminotransferase-like n=1 Tax=Corticium candelabrum TaxID=121492 RepID=UPI002E276E06|nr:phosphoserine aminotransferase-like [Corticium candelabrum]
MSSNILTKENDISKFGVIIAGAQKNIGSAGVTVVIAREDLIGKAHPLCPIILDYKVNADASSVYNTPPVYSVYIMKLVFEWIEQLGGPQVFLDSFSPIHVKHRQFWRCYAHPDHTLSSLRPYRSRMNVTFRIGSREGDAEVEQKYFSEAGKLNMISLKGHRSVGGVRVSMYNAITVEEVQCLAKFMKEFAVRHRQQKN